LKLVEEIGAAENAPAGFLSSFHQLFSHFAQQRFRHVHVGVEKDFHEP
jgi:hypothetical protein